jgi:hypothetical protein
VRIHTGDQAVQLSRDLHAQAFTHGSDVFFGAGGYAPGTPAGRRLLAHELTHVVQQGRAPSSGGSRGGAAPAGDAERIQRKLEWQDTDWTEARRAWQSGEGGLGVVFVTDELGAPPPTYDPVVLKTGEDAPAEVLLAANLHRFGQGKVWRRGAPRVRTVGPDEGRLIKREVGSRVLTGPGWQKVPKAAKAKQNVNNADKPGTMLFEYAGGTEFKDFLTKEAEHTEPKTLGSGRRLTKDSPARLFKDRDFVASLGRITAIDIFTANPDRLQRYNPGNFKVDKVNRTILLIDNVQMASEFAFKSFKNDTRTLTSDQAFRAWTLRNVTKWLRAGDLEAIADTMVESVKAGIENWEQVRPGDIQTVHRALNKSKDWWVQGLKEGRRWLYSAAGHLDQLTEGIAPEDVNEVQESLKERMHYIFPELFPELLRRAWD